MYFIRKEKKKASQAAPYSQDGRMQEMIITFMAGEKKLDVMVKPEQRIADVCRKLCENGFLPMQRGEAPMSVYSMRRKEYVDPLLTLWQGRIYAGDILVIGEEGALIKSGRETCG